MRALALFLLVGAACQRPPTFQNVPFACANSGECADGFVCVMGSCQPEGSEDGGAAAGGAAAGGSAAGGSTAGGSAAGGSAAGGSAAGGSAAGGAAAGGSAAGGSAAGGSAAGGSAAGGSAAGGSAAGGSAAGGSATGGAPDGGSSDAGVAIGGACTTTPACASGLTCVGQVCCERACTGACEVCNLPTNRGRCVNAPAGTACGLFLCNGATTSCPTTCTLDGGCAQGASCSPSSTCQACWSSFTDDFSMGAGRWTLTGATIAGTLSMTVISRNAAPDVATARTMPLPLRGCGVTVELTTAPDVSSNFSGRIALSPPSAPQPSFQFEMDSRGLVAAWALSDGGVGATVVAPPATAWPRWLRIEESAGQVRFRTSSTTTFTTVQSVAHGELLDSVVLRVEAGYPAQPGGSRATLAIDNVNLGP